MKRLLIALVLALSPAVLAVDRVCTPSNFASNFSSAAPGDRLILRSDAGTYGGYWLSNKHGNAGNLIQIIAQDPTHPPVFQTSAVEGLQIASCSYLLFDGIAVQGPMVEGIHLQDAGSGPSNHIIMRNVKVTMGSAAGNIDNWKCDYTSDMLFYNCTGNVNGDVAFDMMGAVGQLVMRSTSNGNTFAHAKNGSHYIGYYKNVITNTGERNFQFGGNGTYNYDQIAMGNVIYGASAQSVVYTTARNDEFRYNTIQNLTGGAVIRILNEGDASAPPTAYNTFSNNLIQYNGSALTWPGGNTDPASFTVANNFWSQTPNFMGYMTETGGLVGNPQLNAEFMPTNPTARDYGAHAPQMEDAWASYTDRFAWAWSYAQQYEPRAEAGTYQIAPGSGVVLSGLGSYAGISPYGPYSINNYEWDLDFDGLFDDAVGASVSLSPSQLAALGLGEGLHYVGLRVRITNEQGQYMYDEGWGKLTVVPNQLPTVNVGADIEAYEGQPVGLHATASDPNSDPLTYSWTQTAGLSATLTTTNAADLAFSAPTLASAANGLLTFQVTVSDGKGGTANDSINVQVYMVGDVNHDLFVNVGDLQALVTAWGSQATPAPSGNWNAKADLNADSYVNVGDLQLLVANWGRSLN